MKKKELRKPKYVTTLENEVVRLAKKVKELEATTLRVGQQLRYNEPKEPETFEDCCRLFKQGYQNECDIRGGFMAQTTGDITDIKLAAGAAVPSEKRAKQLAAIAKMMTVADALNGEPITDGIGLDAWETGVRTTGSYQMVSFKTEALANKAIKILGEDTIKTAFGYEVL